MTSAASSILLRMTTAVPPMRRLTVRLEEDQAVALARLAAADRRTVAQELRHLVDVALAHQDRAT